MWASKMSSLLSSIDFLFGLLILLFLWYFIGFEIIDILFLGLAFVFPMWEILFVIFYYNIEDFLMIEFGSTRYIFFFPNLFALPLYFILLWRYGVIQHLKKHWDITPITIKIGLALFILMSIITVRYPDITLLLVIRFIVGYILKKFS